MSKKDMVRGLISLAIIAWGIFTYTIEISAEPQTYEVRKMRVTCYAPTGNPTASGVMPFEGGCAGRRDWIGGVAVLYDLDMNYICTLQINDCGGHQRLRSGQSIDVYRDSLARCYEWIAEHGDFLMVQVIPDAEG